MILRLSIPAGISSKFKEAFMRFRSSNTVLMLTSASTSALPSSLSSSSMTASSMTVELRILWRALVIF